MENHATRASLLKFDQLHARQSVLDQAFHVKRGFRLADKFRFGFDHGEFGQENRTAVLVRLDTLVKRADLARR